MSDRKERRNPPVVPSVVSYSRGSLHSSLLSFVSHSGLYAPTFLTLPFPLILHSPRVSPAERAAFGRTRGEWGWGRG